MFIEYYVAVNLKELVCCNNREESLEPGKRARFPSTFCMILFVKSTKGDKFLLCARIQNIGYLSENRSMVFGREHEESF